MSPSVPAERGVAQGSQVWSWRKHVLEFGLSPRAHLVAVPPVTPRREPRLSLCAIVVVRNASLATAARVSVQTFLSDDNPSLPNEGMGKLLQSPGSDFSHAGSVVPPDRSGLVWPPDL